jgi:hypothetical protein
MDCQTYSEWERVLFGCERERERERREAESETGLHRERERARETSGAPRTSVKNRETTMDTFLTTTTPRTTIGRVLLAVLIHTFMLGMGLMGGLLRNASTISFVSVGCRVKGSNYAESLVAL